MTISHRISFKSALLAATMFASPLIALAPFPAAAQVVADLSVQLAPPVLPVYSQPPLPEVGYIWTPGYWHWAQNGGYYWVPGTWVLPPTAGMLWTPPYWAFAEGVYLFHSGYWSAQVGYYGGVNYGYGYGGSGYQGGRWNGGSFEYNRSANNFGRVHVDHAYQQPVAAASRSRVSFAGGAHGVRSTPTAQEHAAEHDQHVPVTAEQSKHIGAAASEPALSASHNRGRPAVAATSHAGQFKGPGVVRAQPAVATHAAARPAVAHPAVTHAAARPAAPARAEAPAAHPAVAHTAARPPIEHAAAHAATAEKGKEEKPEH